MKRNFLKSTERAALVAVFLLGLFLPAGARAQGNGQVPVQAPVWLSIMAFTDAPVVGADVRVTVHGQLLADAKAATNDQGMFPARIWQPWLLADEARRANGQSFVHISISGGKINGDAFFGRLSADVVLTDPAHQLLVVNPVTTVVSRVLEERPELKLDGAEALVRRFLKLPANYSLGLALRQSSGYASPFFSPVAFMAEAQEAGGLDGFERLLLQELRTPSVTHPFRQPKLLGNEESSLAEDLAKAALKSAGGQLAGWIMKQTGLVTPDATQMEIDALRQQLNDLQSSLENLTTQVDQLTQLVKSTATQELYNTITNTAQDYATKITKHESDLNTYAQWCPPLAEGSKPPTTEDPYCVAQRPDVISELHTEYLDAYYEEVEGYIQDNGTLGTEGMIHLYSLWLGQSRQFFRVADSTKMQNLYDYWDGILTSAANLRMEYFHYLNFQDPNSPGGNATITEFIGNPDLSPPTTGVFQADRANNVNLMFPPVPTDPAFSQNGGVVISTQDRTMWALAPWVGTGPYHPPAFAVPQPSCATWPSPFLGVPNVLNASPLPYLGFSNWATSPSKAQWQAAVSLAPTNGSMTWQQWLMQQTQTTDDEMPPSNGFFVWANQCSSAISSAAWTSTLDHIVNGIFLWYSYINPATNSFSSAVSSGSSGGNNASGGTYLFDFPVRTLAAGEQYYWYK